MFLLNLYLGIELGFCLARLRDSILGKRTILIRSFCVNLSVTEAFHHPSIMNVKEPNFKHVQKKVSRS